MQPLTAQSTAQFECRRAIPLSRHRVPKGCRLKLLPDTFFRTWRGKSVHDSSRVYLSTEFSQRIVRALEPEMLDDNPVRQAAYFWYPRSGVQVTWGDVYRYFPVHGPRADDHQVIPWRYLQELVFGWGDVAAPIPRNDRGALFMLGNAGQPVTSPSGAITIGTLKFLVQCSFFAMVGPATWVLAMPNLESSDLILPADMIIITVQPY